MTMAKKKSGRELREEREHMLVLRHKYANRITIARFGKEALDAGNYSTALKKYSEYFDIIVEVKGSGNWYGLKPSHFDPKLELTEMLMISHIFFEMARLYDAVPKYHDEVKKCLEQFVTFTANQPYQVVNSEMARKCIRKSLFKNPDAFSYAYQQIHVQSKKCYVVTFCFGNEHPITQDCRAFKDRLLDFPWGQELVRQYYRFSSVAVNRWGENSFAKFISKYAIRPLLVLFSKIVLPFILRK